MLKQRQFDDGIPGVPLTAILGPRRKRQPLAMVYPSAVAMLLTADIILARDTRTGESLTLLGQELIDRIDAGEDVGEHFVLPVNLNMRTRDVNDLMNTLEELRDDCDFSWWPCETLT